MDRRQFLQRGGFFTVVAATGTLAACGGSDDAPAAPAPPAEPAGRYQFTEGVASGDPRDTSVVFWARCTRANGTAVADMQQTARRRAASRAWLEYMPIDFGDVSFDTNNQAYDNLRIYRSFQFGSLMQLLMTDERLYRDDHVVPEAAVGRSRSATIRSTATTRSARATSCRRHRWPGSRPRRRRRSAACPRCSGRRRPNGKDTLAASAVTPQSWVVVYNKVAPLNPDGTAPTSPLLKRTRITLAAGSTTPTVEDDV